MCASFEGGVSEHVFLFILMLFFVSDRWKMSESKSSLHRRRQDVEAGASGLGDDADSFSVFDITRTKHASTDRLKRWRVSVFDTLQFSH